MPPSSRGGRPRMTGQDRIGDRPVLVEPDVLPVDHLIDLIAASGVSVLLIE